MPMTQKAVVLEGNGKIEVMHDETPAIIVDHRFSPRGEWWDLCRICHLAESAHTNSELHYYSDDNPEE